MARGRMLLASISLSEQMADMPDADCRLIATWTIPHLDREGRITASPRRLRVIAVPLLPYTDADVARAIDAMCVGPDPIAVRYTDASGQLVLWFPKFRQAQTGARFDREAESRFGPPPGVTPGVTPAESGASPDQVPLNACARACLTSLPFSSASPDPDACARVAPPGNLAAELVEVFPDLAEDAKGLLSELQDTFPGLDYVQLAKEGRLWKRANKARHSGASLLRKWCADAWQKRQALKARVEETVAQVGAARPDYHAPARLKSRAELDGLAAESLRLEAEAEAQRRRERG